ncbi:MFS transporter [Ferrimonas aestuarii]|uniref:MFS transporter n=1 Tax=Ferrimonas aestuarii TaxID=2569539 RepID=UPI00145FB321|nr:MFS transporter [Ferrimonas aestuarii]
MSEQFWQPVRQTLASNYFFFFAILGLTVPYMGVYLDLRGFNSEEIGALMAIIMGTRIIAPFLWASFADATGRRAMVVKVGAGMAMLGFSGLFFAHDFWSVALVLAFYSFFWNAILAQLEVLTLGSLGAKAHQYSKVRSFGSMGYLLVVIIGGWVFERWDAGLLPWIGFSLFVSLFITTLPLNAPIIRPNKDSSGSLKLTVTGALFILFAMGIQASHGPFYGFYVLYLQQLGIGESIAGILVAFGVLVEIAIFAIAPRLLGRYQLTSLMMACALFTALRWWLTAEMDSAAGQALATSLHAISFGLSHSCAMQYIHKEYPSHFQGRAQALYASLTFGIGGASGVYVSGHLWKLDHNYIWYLGVALALISVLAVLGIQWRNRLQRN